MGKGVAHLDQHEIRSLLDAAKGKTCVDLIIRNVHYLDVFHGCFRLGEIAVHKGIIVGINDVYQGQEVLDAKKAYLVPGFIDAHVHIESSLLTPNQFERMVLPKGTTTVLWDPHEIANIKGKDGIEWALDSTEELRLEVFVMASSCVPATDPNLQLETAAHILKAEDMAEFAHHPRVLGLAELMNYPAALAGESDMLQKLQDFAHLNLDGHCPQLQGKELSAYAMLGIMSCHESTTLAEANEKLNKGIHVLIREGSCAKDADNLLPMLNAMTSSEVGFCSDDRNPLDSEQEGHIDFIVSKALKMGIAPEVVFRAAAYTPARLYGLKDRGAIAPGYIADLILLSPNGKWKKGMTLHHVFKKGEKIDPLILGSRAKDHYFTSKNINMPVCTLDDIKVEAASRSHRQKVRVIGLRPNEIITDNLEASLVVIDNEVQSDVTQDVLKMVVLERHRGAGYRGIGFVQGFGLKQGAIATSISHDAHNVMVVGTDDQMILLALRHMREMDGGIVVVNGQGAIESLPLPVAGLMTDRLPDEVAADLVKLKKMTAQLGCPLKEPFLQLSFLALPVIPSLKLTDRGLVDTLRFERVDLCL